MKRQTILCVITIGTVALLLLSLAPVAFASQHVLERTPHAPRSVFQKYSLNYRLLVVNLTGHKDGYPRNVNYTENAHLPEEMAPDL